MEGDELNKIIDIRTGPESRKTQKNLCHAGMTIAGLAVGGATRSVVGVVVLGLAGFLYGATSCGKIVDKINKPKPGYIDEASFRRFEKELEKYHPVTRQEVKLLANLAQKQKLPDGKISIDPHFKKHFKQFVNDLRARQA